LKAKSSLMFTAPDRNKPKVEPKPEPLKKVESDKEEEELVETAPIDVDKVIIIFQQIISIITQTHLTLNFKIIYVTFF